MPCVDPRLLLPFPFVPMRAAFPPSLRMALSCRLLVCFELLSAAAHYGAADAVGVWTLLRGCELHNEPKLAAQVVSPIGRCRRPSLNSPILPLAWWRWRWWVPAVGREAFFSRSATKQSHLCVAIAVAGTSLGERAGNPRCLPPHSAHRRGRLPLACVDSS